jgi:transcriptional regulator with XRE-family HTH domain
MEFIRMSSADSLARFVSGERQRRAWSQDHLAKAAGLSLRTVQRVERGAPCSGETIQALAGALGLEMSQLTDRLRDMPRRNRVVGLSISKWVGAILCLPATIFAVLNIAYYEVGLSALAPIMDSTAWNTMVNHHLALLFILGGPFITLLLIVSRLVKLRAHVDSASMTISGLVIRWSPGHYLVGGLALVLLVTIVWYGVIENLGQGN